MNAPDLDFAVVGAEVPNFAAQPTLVFKLLIKSADKQIPIQSIVLRCQLRLAVTRRRYSPQEKTRLLEVFGEPQRWGETLRDLLWTHAGTLATSFTGESTVDLPVPCTYDFEIASTKYFAALDDGQIPLHFLFSGTIFYTAADGNLQAGQISWQKEAAYELPVSVWRAMIERYYPGCAWLRLRKELFAQLYQYKAERGLPTWDEVIAQLLENAGMAQPGAPEARSGDLLDLKRKITGSLALAKGQNNEVRS